MKTSTIGWVAMSLTLVGVATQSLLPVYSIIATEHDKIIFEVPVEQGSVEELKRLMTQDVPEGLPMTVDGKRVKRYGK